MMDYLLATSVHFNVALRFNDNDAKYAGRCADGRFHSVPFTSANGNAQALNDNDADNSVHMCRLECSMTMLPTMPFARMDATFQ